MLTRRFTRSRWLTIIALVLMMMLALSWKPAPSAAWTGSVQIINKAGNVMGTATFTPTAHGQTQVTVNVRGFEPIGGDRHMVISKVGYCAPPNFRAYAGPAVFTLPAIQFFPDGSASYQRTATIPSSTFNSHDGSALLIHADVHEGSDVIACGVIIPKDTPPVVFPPAPKPPAPKPPAPPSHVCPITPPAVSPTTVVAPLGLKMRSGAGLTFGTILTLQNGETVYPVSELTSNQGISWVKVRVFRSGACYEGWVSATYLARWAGSTPTPSGEWRVTAGAGLRLRSGPGLSYGIRRIVPVGTRLGFTGVEQYADGYTWVKVRINGVEFWAAKNYLQRIS